MMRSLVFWAVVERVVKYPFRGAAWRALCPCRKGFVQVKNACDITWGYVASMGQGGGGRGEFSERWGALRCRACRVEQCYKNGRKAL